MPAHRKHYETIKRSITFHLDTVAQLEKLAARKHTTTAAFVRELVEKGLTIEGYKQDLDLIATIVRQEIKSQLDAQMSRMAKMHIKTGKISAGLYYLVMKLLLLINPNPNYARTLKDLATETRKMGI